MNDTFKRYVVGFLTDSDGEDVVLIRKTHPAWQKGLLNGVGGNIESGETPHQAMVREFREEAGVITYESDWRYVARLYSDQYECYFFHCANTEYYDNSATTDALTMEGEGERIVKIPVFELRAERCIDNLHWLIPLCMDRYVKVPIGIATS